MCSPSRLLFSFLLAAAWAFAQRGVGEVRVQVRDPSGLPVRAAGDLTGESLNVTIAVQSGADGRFIARGVPFGSYRLALFADGFDPYEGKVEVVSEVPVAREIALAVAGPQSVITISDAALVLNPSSPRNYTGASAMRERTASQPGWGVLEVVRTQPGWLLEANGVLHPRGSEYQTQYVVDGLPVLDNRSPAYAPGADPEQLQSVTVLTAGYPAEYGRKLGGVVEMVSSAPPGTGFHGYAVSQAASFAERSGSANVSYVSGRIAVSLFGDAGGTERYLDPPSLSNYANRGTNESGGGSIEYAPGAADRLRLRVSSLRSGFEAPNTDVQQDAGQRQDRRNTETDGAVSWTHILSPSVLLAVRGSVRDLSAALWSNSLATPIIADQDRGFREGYASVSAAGHQGRHDWKVGSDVLIASVREQFDYRITNPDAFDTGLPASYFFQNRRRSREHAVFAQDQAKLGRFAVSAGLRWDAYRFLVRDSCLSPRLGVTWHSARAGLLLRASYDRVYQTPAIENLLLASARSAQTLTAGSTGLPVPPSRANFYETGFSKTLGGHVRLDASYYWRRIRDFADDDVFLNTGVSFPISFRSARIHGAEARLELPRWGRFSGMLSYSNLNGVSSLPVTGGLFLTQGGELLQSHDTLPITQDQRNTAYGRVRFQAASRLWLAAASSYGSGLPFEQDNGPPEVTDPRILNRVNLARGRVRPRWSLDLSAGADLLRRERSTITLQADVLNVTNRTNIINFSGLFSGTAIASPRCAAVRAAIRF